MSDESAATPLRGHIIQYNPAEARGLIAVGGKQYPFRISDWCSDTAPEVNSSVDFFLNGEQSTESVSRTPDEVIMRERAGEIAGKLGTLGAAALAGAGVAADQIKTAARDSGRNGTTPLPIAFFGKPMVVAYAAFVAGAWLLPYVNFHLGPGMPSSGFSLLRLGELGEKTGLFSGGNTLVWLAILAPLVPLLWRNRLAWLALLLPLLASTRPLQLAGKIALDAARAEEGSAAGLTSFVLELLDVGMGAYVCVGASLVLALLAIGRIFVHKSAQSETPK